MEKVLLLSCGNLKCIPTTQVQYGSSSSAQKKPPNKSGGFFIMGDYKNYFGSSSLKN